MHDMQSNGKLANGQLQRIKQSFPTPDTTSKPGCEFAKLSKKKKKKKGHLSYLHVRTCNKIEIIFI